MNIVRYNFKNFQAIFNVVDGRLLIHCNIDGTSYSRGYDNILDIDHISCDGEYMIFTNKSYTERHQLKFEYDSCVVIDKFSGNGNDFIDSIGSHDFNDEIDMDDDCLVTQLMKIRANWNWNDFKDAYGDEWEEIPATLEGCFELMEEYILHTYAEDYLLEVIADEKV